MFVLQWQKNVADFRQQPRLITFLESVQDEFVENFDETKNQRRKYPEEALITMCIIRNIMLCGKIVKFSEGKQKKIPFLIKIKQGYFGKKIHFMRTSTTLPALIAPKIMSKNKVPLNFLAAERQRIHPEEERNT